MSARRSSSCAPTRQPKPICARRSACSTDAAMSASSSMQRALPSPGGNSALMMDMAMTNELPLTRRLGRLALAIGLTLASAGAFAQDAPPPASGVSYPAPTVDAGPGPEAAPTAAPSGARHSRGEVRPYLEVTQVLSAELGNGGNTLTYTSVAAGVDGRVQTRRVTAQASLRYERDIDWNGHVAQRDNISGLATVHAEVAPGLLSVDAGGLATRTGGPGRVFGVTN